MANALYDTGRNAFLKGDIDWVNDDIRVTLVDTADYAVNLSSHDFYNDIAVAARVATGTLAGKAASAGIADANDLTFSAVTGDQSEALVIWKYNATESLAQLIAYIDSATGLPVTPSGGDIIIAWDNGSNKIFKL